MLFSGRPRVAGFLDATTMQFWQFFGDLHPKLVQFPLVLLLAGLICDSAGLISRSPAFNKSRQGPLRRRALSFC